MDASFPRIVTFFSLMIVGAGADLASKWWVFDGLGPPGASPPYWLIDGVFGFQTAINLGAVFGLGAGGGPFFAAFSVVALVGVCVWMLRYGGADSWWLTVTLGAISGGIIGNLYDRLVHPGVRDWILFRLEGVPLFDPWPNFNIADALLVVGAASLLVYSFVTPSDAPPDLEDADGDDVDIDHAVVKRDEPDVGRSNRRSVIAYDAVDPF